MLLATGLKTMASSLKEEIRSAVKETSKEELSRALSERKSTVEKRTNDCKAENPKEQSRLKNFMKNEKPIVKRDSNQERERRKILHQLTQQQQMHRKK